ncbi:MAG: ISAs1 family transposase [Nitrospiraceae bacterium]
MSVAFVGKVYEHFENVTDPRVNRGANYPLVEMVFVALCGAICDCNSWVDVAEFGRAKLNWFRKFLPLEQGIPSHDTFTEVFARLDTIEFYAALESWAHSIARSLQGETVAFDGKTLRGSFDRGSSQSALHSVSAWACGLKLCLALKSVEDKSNEIPAVQQLIDLLDLAGAVVTADAMHCQRVTAEKIIAKDADYVLMVKGNQETLETAVQQVMVQAFETEHPKLRQCRKTERNRNRRETRQVAALPVPKDSAVFARWAGIKTIGSIYRTREIDGRVEESQAFFLTSLPCTVREIARHLRSHWSIENSQHHVLDVTFTEDASRIRKGTGPEISSVFRRLALQILQQDTTVKASLRGKRKICGWSEPAFERLIAGFSGV